MTSTTSTRDGVRKSRTAPTAPGTHSRRTGRNPKYVPDDGFHPALPQPSAGGTEHAPDTAGTAQDFRPPPTAVAAGRWRRRSGRGRGRDHSHEDCEAKRIEPRLARNRAPSHRGRPVSNEPHHHNNRPARPPPRPPPGQPLLALHTAPLTRDCSSMSLHWALNGCHAHQPLGAGHGQPPRHLPAASDASAGTHRLFPLAVTAEGPQRTEEEQGEHDYTRGRLDNRRPALVTRDPVDQQQAPQQRESSVEPAAESDDFHCSGRERVLASPPERSHGRRLPTNSHLPPRFLLCFLRGPANGPAARAAREGGGEEGDSASCDAAGLRGADYLRLSVISAVTLSGPGLLASCGPIGCQQPAPHQDQDRCYRNTADAVLVRHAPHQQADAEAEHRPIQSRAPPVSRPCPRRRDTRIASLRHTCSPFTPLLPRADLRDI